MLSWSTALFLRLNAAAMPSAAMQALAEAAAGAPVVLAPMLLTCLWAWRLLIRRACLAGVAAGWARVYLGVHSGRPGAQIQQGQ